MKIINQSVNFIRKYDFNQIVRDIETTASVSHMSTKVRDLHHAREFIRQLCELGHCSVLENSMVGFKIVTSRDVSHQIVRHRHLQFCQASQRYNRYGEVTFIAPTRIKDDSEAYKTWHKAMKEAEKAYMILLSHKVPAEVARLVLPNSTATTLIVSGNLRAWREYLQLRTDIHTQMEHRIIAKKIQYLLKTNLPEVF